MVDVGTSGQRKKQHNPDGAADREAVHAARSIRIGFAFERRERFQRGRQNALGSNRWTKNWIGDPLFRCGGRFQLWERNLNFGRWFGRRFWNGDGNNGFRGNFCGWWPRADRRKFQERRQWRRFPLLERRMDRERERWRHLVRRRRGGCGQAHPGLQGRRLGGLSYRRGGRGSWRAVCECPWPWWWGVFHDRGD